MMNQKIIGAILFVFAFCGTLTIAAGQKQQQNRQQEQQQCTCDQQQKCIFNIKCEIDGCFDECEVSVDLKSTINESSNIGPCMEQRKKMVFDFYDCVGQELTGKQSCIKGTDNQKQQIEFVDFVDILEKHKQPVAQKTLKTFQELAKSLEKENDFLNAAIELNKCSLDCGKKKLAKFDCFQEQNCTMKVTDELVKDTMNQCIKKLDVHKRMVETCECFNKNVDKTLLPFCEKLEKADIPQQF